MQKEYSRLFVFVAIIVISSLAGYTSVVKAETSLTETLKKAVTEAFTETETVTVKAEHPKTSVEKAESHKHACAACEKGQSGETVWCESCGAGYVKGDKVKCKHCFEGMSGKKDTWCESCNAGYLEGKNVDCKECCQTGKICKTCQNKAEHSKTDVKKAESFSTGFPYGYKDWTNTFAKVVQEKGPFHGFLRVLVSSQALDAYKNGSKGYENGDVLILEFNEIENEDDGPVKGETNWIAVMEKNSYDVETGGWHFSAFDGKTKKLKAEINPVNDCYICHKAVMHRDYVFSELK